MIFGDPESLDSDFYTLVILPGPLLLEKHFKMHDACFLLVVSCSVTYVTSKLKKIGTQLNLVIKFFKLLYLAKEMIFQILESIM